MSLFESYLCPPGSGVFTVNTAKEKKEALHLSLYQTKNANKVTANFFANLKNFNSLPNDKVAMLGVCSDTGGGIMRGANWGPLYIREKIYQAGLGSKLVELGDVRVIPHLLHDKYLNDETKHACQKALYGEQNNLAVSPLSITEALLEEAYASIDNFRVFALGGDHSVSYPLVKNYFKARENSKVGLIHFDAHTDLLHSRLGIDLCFGSWLTHVLPFIESPSRVVQLGIRSSAQDKSHWESNFGLTQYWAKEIKEQGMGVICEKAVASFKSQGVEEIYISFDIDALDSAIASATGTPEPDGLSVTDCVDAIDIFSKNFKLGGADLVEVAPLVNSGSSTEPESTLNAALKLSEALILGLTS